MRTVNTVVEFVNKTGEVVYGVPYTGVMDSNHIYAKMTKMSCFADYIKVALTDTVDTTGKKNSIIDVTHRNVKVSEKKGLHDPKIHILKEDQIPKKILIAINDAVRSTIH